MQSGRIRFCGGPLHNQILPVEQWTDALSIEMSREHSETDQGNHVIVTCEVYRLVRMRLATGCVYWEYHSDNMRPEQAEGRA